MYQYRNALARMRQGDSDRDIARSKTMGRKKLAQVRELASERGWLSPEFPLPDDGVLAALFARKDALPASCLSTLEPWRAQVAIDARSNRSPACRHAPSTIMLPAT